MPGASRSSTSSSSDAAFMREALREARRAVGRVHPNPAVGCVIVQRGRVVARGYTHAPGKQHAEVDALRKIGLRAPGATAYVTLEPCTDALIEAGVARVVCGTRDPNPIARGGLEKLRRAGIVAESGVLEDECRAVNEAWLHFIVARRPLVTLKGAVTLDGRIAARGGDSKWITGELARAEAHRLRATHDAILVGANTVRADDPALTVRYVRGRDPVRVVLGADIPARAKVLPALVVTTPTARVAPALARSAEIVRVSGRGGRVDMGALLEELGRRNLQSLLVEGGGDVHGQLLAAGLVDRAALFVAPKLIGAGGVPLVSAPGAVEMSKAWKLQNISWKRLGDDILVRGAFVW